MIYTTVIPAGVLVRNATATRTVAASHMHFIGHHPWIIQISQA
jgi:hypothetical protein